MAKKFIIIFISGLALFAALSFYSYPSICCMFSANRYYGWPYPYLNLHKTVETLDEANLVKTENVFDLMRNGWHFSFSGDMVNSSPLGPLGNIFVDFIVSIIFAGIIFYFVKFIRHKLL
ncbi:hypothetical protein C4569_00845 [Candidatus Parcubacteria bacterium]|nr:MAG: hypothetical protein C4569_00845 [Candidatus Parcubacteria bacterium]